MPASARHSANTAGALVMLGALACWSTGPNFIKYLTGHFDLWTQNFYRYLTACLALLPALIAAGRRGRLDPAVWRRALAPSVINVVMQSGWAACLYYINPGFMILITKSSVLWVAIFSFALFPEERPLIHSRRFWVAAALSLAGLGGVVLASPGFAAEGTATGIVLTLVTAVLWAAYSVSAKAAFGAIPSMQGFAVVCLYTTAGLGLAALVFSRPFAGLPAAAAPWAGIVISGILSIAVAHVLFYGAMKRIGATIPALILLASPFTVLAVSSVAFGERITAAQWGWGALLIAGSVLAILAQQGLGTPRGE